MIGGSPAKRSRRAGLRAALRRLSLGIPTVLGLRQRGFFIPYRLADGIVRSGASSPYAAVEACLARCEPAFARELSELRAFAAALTAIAPDAQPPAPRWNQDWFARLDAAIAYALVRRRRPAQIIEVGSGHSTRFLARAVADGGLPTRIVAIDPAPRAAIVGLAVEWMQHRVQDVGLDLFETLSSGDVLFVDSSHVLMPGSDVDFLLNRVLPLLPTGALVHIHDVFLADDYPSEWRWRGYNEQAALGLCLLSGGWEVVFASHHVVSRMATAFEGSLAAGLPLVAGAHESSLWLRRTAAEPPKPRVG